MFVLYLMATTRAYTSGNFRLPFVKSMELYLTVDFRLRDETRRDAPVRPCIFIVQATPYFLNTKHSRTISTSSHQRFSTSCTIYPVASLPLPIYTITFDRIRTLARNNPTFMPLHLDLFITPQRETTTATTTTTTTTSQQQTKREGV